MILNKICPYMCFCASIVKCKVYIGLGRCLYIFYVHKFVLLSRANPKKGEEEDEYEIQKTTSQIHIVQSYSRIHLCVYECVYVKIRTFLTRIGSCPTDNINRICKFSAKNTKRVLHFGFIHFFSLALFFAFLRAGVI